MAEEDGLAARFARDGFVVGLPVLSPAEAAAFRDRIERFEQAFSGTLPVAAMFRTGAHIVSTAADALVRHPAVLDAVATLLGPDLLVWDSDVIVKEPGSRGHVSWHQDLTYWGVDSTEAVTAWIALTDSTGDMGCMRYIPGSHLTGQMVHDDTFEATNLLMRGQTVAGVDESAAVEGPLRAGEMAIHHGLTLHASAPNRSDCRRIGLAIRYAVPAMKPVVAERDYAQLVKGTDRFGHFQPVPRPAADGDAAAVEAWRRITDDQAGAYFTGVDAAGRRSWTGGEAAS